MESFYQQITNLLITNPGNLSYHLILLFAMVWALQFSLQNRSVHASRVTLGLSLMLGVRVVLFLASTLSTRIVGIENLLPILDRSANTLGLLILVWLWSLPEDKRAANAAALLLGLLLLTLTALSISWWQTQPERPALNETWLNDLWEICGMLLALIAILLLWVQQPSQWQLAWGLFLLTFGSHAAQWMLPFPQTDLPGTVRLIQLIAYPMLLLNLVPQSVAYPIFSNLHPKQEPADLSLNLLNTSLSALNQNNTQHNYHALLETLLNATQAQQGLILDAPQPNGRMNLLACSPAPQKDLHYLLESDIPIISNAIKRARPLRLPANSTSQDARNIEKIFPEGSNSHLLALPITGETDTSFPGVILLRQDSAWTREQQDLLTTLCQNLGNLLQRLNRINTYATEMEQLQRTIESTRAQVDVAQRVHYDLLTEFEALQEHNNQQRQQIEQLIPQANAAIEAQIALEQTQKELQKLKKQRGITEPDKAAQAQIAELEYNLRASLQEVAQLKQKLAESDRKLLEATRQTSQQPTPTLTPVIASELQTMLQSVASIAGYTELLLTESAGILGASQRKFLERIKTATERLTSNIEELHHSIYSQNASLNPQRVAINRAIDRAIDSLSAEIAAKDLLLRVDLPETLPELHVDPQALQQIITNLLQNAVSITPAQGEVTLRADFEPNQLSGQTYILLQITDSGGGIAPEDQPRVFTPGYRTPNAPIRGLSHNTADLSTVKILVEALQGRIWLDSQAGIGTTFSILLPIQAGDVAPISQKEAA